MADNRWWALRTDKRSIIDPFLMMNAFFTVAGTSALTKKIGGKENTFLHGYMMMGAAGLAAMGGYVIWSNKNMYNKPHLTSEHGQFGALTLVWMVSASLPSYILFTPENGTLRQNQLARKVHKIAGRLCIACGLITCAYGIMSLEKDVYKASALIISLLATTPAFLL
jgi:hypothetical protein